MRSFAIRPGLRSALILIALAGCGGGGGGDTAAVDALSAPDQISLLEAEEAGIDTGASSSDDSFTLGAGDVPADSDYSTDVSRVHVFDPSMQPLSMINMILCYVTHTAYTQMLNEGDYKAQTDVRLCENGAEGGDQGSNSGESSSSEAAEFMLFTVNSARETRDSDQVVKFWVHEEDETIHAKLVVSEGASDENPFGAFHMDFAGVPASGTEADARMQGALATLETEGTQGFQLYESEGDLEAAHTEPGQESHEIAVAVSADPQIDSGVARILQSFRGFDFMGDTGIQTQEWKVAYNATHFKRQLDDDAEKTYSRTEFVNHAWRYNLYYADGDQIGDRVELNSGFGFHTDDDQFGWIGYYGLWVPEGVAIETGDTITENTYDGTTGATYTILRAPGKLIRHVRETMDLVDLEGNLFNWWHQGEGTNYQLDYAAGTFNKIAYFDAEGSEWIPIDPPVVVDVEAEGGFLHMWSESLGGSVSYLLGDDFVTFFSQEFVNGSSSLFDGASGDTVALYGYLRCLDSEITGGEAETGDIFLTDALDIGSPYVFVFDGTDLTLYRDVNEDGSLLTQVGLADGEAPTFGPNLWGMMSGPLVVSTDGLTNVWEIWGVEEFYTYETGHNSWNGYATAVDALGEFVHFDAPLSFLYTHSQENDLNDDDSYAGEGYFLHYNGPGDLWGIPHDGVDFDGDGHEDRWYPRFSIRGGTLLGPTGTEYLLRPIEIEQALAEDESGSDALDLSEAEALELPDASLYTAPGVGDAPVVDGPPAVVNGVVIGN